MLQQTLAERVPPVLETVISRFPTWTDLAGAQKDELENLLRPLGIHRRRAATLIALARTILARGSLPDSAEELQSLPGVGQYMSRAIAVQLRGELVAPVDVNVARILERVFGPRTLADIRYDPQLQALALQLVPPEAPASYLISLLDFAAAYCRAKNPRCGECPIKRCRHREASRHIAVGRPSTA